MVTHAQIQKVGQVETWMLDGNLLQEGSGVRVFARGAEPLNIQHQLLPIQLFC